jgi:hypothetical protein
MSSKKAGSLFIALCCVAFIGHPAAASADDLAGPMPGSPALVAAEPAASQPVQASAVISRAASFSTAPPVVAPATDAISTAAFKLEQPVTPPGLPPPPGLRPRGSRARAVQAVARLVAEILRGRV